MDVSTWAVRDRRDRIGKARELVREFYGAIKVVAEHRPGADAWRWHLQVGKHVQYVGWINYPTEATAIEAGEEWVANVRV